VSGPSGIDTEIETAFIVVTAGMIGADDLWTLKPHYYRNYAGFKLGAVVMDMSSVTVDEEEFKYSRIFLNSCFTGKYFFDKFHRGPTFYTFANSGGSFPVADYLRLYLEGASDREILTHINSLDNIFDYYNFDLPPP
jgi:hypothetical protein